MTAINYPTTVLLFTPPVFRVSLPYSEWHISLYYKCYDVQYQIFDVHINIDKQGLKISDKGVPA